MADRERIFMRRLTDQTRKILQDKLFWFSGYREKDYKFMNDEELYEFARRMLTMGTAWRSKAIQESHINLLNECLEELYADELIEQEFLDR